MQSLAIWLLKSEVGAEKVMAQLQGVGAIATGEN
jgi:hypothetical protein